MGGSRAIAELGDHRAERIDAPIRRATVPVGAVNDPAEAEADRIAARALAADYSVRREAHDRSADGLEVDQHALRRAARGGQAMPDGIRSQIEHTTGADLSGVRIHTGAESQELARGMSAKAFTHGSDIHFADGEYNPGSATGQQVLAHEAAHVVQNSGGVHRFPADWLSTPVAWGGLTGAAVRPGEGASGGVVLLTTNDPNALVRKVVVKPIFGKNAKDQEESGEQLHMGDVLLARMFGINAPQSKVVKPGAEFNELIAACSRAAQDTSDLAKAQSLVVMSEVPHGAKSMAKLLEGTGAGNAQDRSTMMRTLFSHQFLFDLGKLCVADLAMGNQDRFVMGGANFGNIMIAQANPGQAGELWAIDTTVLHEKAYSPSVIANSASGGAVDLKESMTAGPTHHLADFWRMLVWMVREKTPQRDPGQEVEETWQQLEQAWANGKARLLVPFTAGWNAGIATVTEVAAKQRGSLAPQTYESDALGGATMAGTFDYIAKRGAGGDHDSSVGRLMALHALDWASTIDRTRFVPDLSDVGAMPAVPAKDVLKAEVAPMPTLPKKSDLTGAMPNGSAPLTSVKWARSHGLASAVQRTRNVLDGGKGTVNDDGSRAIGATKKRGVFNKKEVRRNRNVAAHFVADATAQQIAAVRLADSVNSMAATAGVFASFSAAEFKVGESAPIALLARDVLFATSGSKAQLEATKSAIAITQAGLQASTSSQAADVSAALEKSSGALDLALGQLDKRLKPVELGRVIASYR